MTAIVYHQGMLIGDTQHVALTTPIVARIAPKIFISRCKQFAYGFTGKSITPSMKITIEKELRSLLEKMVLYTDDRVSLSSLHFDKDRVKIERGIVITKTSEFWFIGDNNYVQRSNGISSSCGSGGTMILSMLYCEMSLTDAFKKISELDPMTGQKFDIIYQKNLKPFIIKGE